MTHWDVSYILTCTGTAQIAAETQEQAAELFEIAIRQVPLDPMMTDIEITGIEAAPES